MDFHWEVDGKTYDFSMRGGSYLSFTELVKKLGIADDSQDAQEFVAAVAAITFSSPNLLSVSKAEKETTVGNIKDQLGLVCEYSSEMTAGQIEQINQTVIVAGDWALISLKAFDTEESLTVTMKDGEVFEIRVTDAQTPVELDTSGLSGKISVDLFDYYGNKSDHSQDNLDTSTNHLTGTSSTTGTVSDGINAGHDLKFMAYGYDGGNSINHFTGGTTIRQGIVQNILIDGYPKLATGSKESLDYLFKQANGTGKLYKGSVEGLFYKANSDGSYNGNGIYYAYDSDRYYAYYKNDGTIEHHVADIKIETTRGGGGSTTNDGTAGDPIGFFPLDPYNSNMTCPHPRDITWYYSPNHYDNHPSYNHSFGLSMSGDFQIPKGGKVKDKDEKEYDMIFSFSGDDDMWVFIDDVLVLDIGGIHHPSSGVINFTQGTVTVDNAVTGVSGNDNTINQKNGSKVTANIADLFSAANKTWDSSDYSSHTIKVFYLERGGIYSNCKITFNIPLTLGQGQATIVKKDASTGTTVNDGFLEGATFGLWDNADCSGEPFMTQTSGSDGKITFSGLPVDTVNRKYYLKEIEAPENYILSTEIYTLSVGEKGSDNIYTFTVTDSNGQALQTIGQSPALPVITNQPEVQTGSMKITKHVTIDNQSITSDYADGTYYFTIVDSKGNPATGKVDGVDIVDGKVGITITNGASNTVIITDMPIGSYTITEDEPNNGTSLTKIDNVTATSASTGVTIEKEAVTEKSFTNNRNLSDMRDTTSVTVKKEWYKTDGTSTEKMTSDEISGKTIKYKLTQYKAKVPYSNSESIFPVVVRMLDSSGNLLKTRTYYVKKGAKPNLLVTKTNTNDEAIRIEQVWLGGRYDKAETKSPDKNNSKQYNYTLIGIQSETMVTIRAQKSTTKLSDFALTTNYIADNPKSYLEELANSNFAFAENSSAEITLKGDTENVFFTLDGVTYSASDADWQAVIKDLPFYEVINETPGGRVLYVYKYDVTEIEVDGETITVNQDGTGNSASYEVVYDRTTQDTTLIKNIQQPGQFNLRILKVDKNTPAVKLENATFSIRKLVETNASAFQTEDSFTREPVKTNSNGEALLEDLPAGIYEIEETGLPAGYVLSTFGGKAYVKVHADGIMLLKSESGKAPKDWEALDSSEADAGYLSMEAETLTIGNTPGATLPSTGGPGSRPLILAGSLFLLLAGVGLLVCRRKKWISSLC